MNYFILFYISTVQEVAPTQLYKKKHDTKISMVGDTLLIVVVLVLSTITIISLQSLFQDLKI